MSEILQDERILITGGTGFLGKYVLKRLVSDGAEPIVLSRNMTTEFVAEYKEKIIPVEIDLGDFRAVCKVFEIYKPHKVIHLAGSSGKNKESEKNLEKINYEVTARLLEIAVESGVKRIIITGTADEYGFQTPPQKETMPAKPVSEYAVSKNKAVNHALFLFKERNLPVVILRPFTVYGIGQPSEMFVSQAVECALRNIPLAMSNGTQKRDLVFVEDFADAMMKALSAGKIEGEIFNVGSGTAIALRDLALKIWDIAGADIKLLKIGARRTNENELHDTLADISKIKAVLGWESKISIDEGLKIIIKEKRKKLNER
jgi:nucleoside-diphosphate-sugar epimerase